MFCLIHREKLVMNNLPFSTMPFECIEPAKLYAKDPLLKKGDIEIIQEWLKKQGHLPELEETQIVLFLFSCYYQIEPTKTAIDSYFTARNLCPEVFAALKPEEVELNLSVVGMTVLPKRTPKGYLVFLIKLLDTRAENFDCAKVVNCINMVATLHLHQNGFDEGVVCVLDAKGFSWSHVTKFNLNAIKYGLFLLQEGLPVRLKEIHIVNANPFVNKAIVLVKPFLQANLYNMIQLHSPNSDRIYESVSEGCLPQDVGGVLPSTRELNEQGLNNLLDNYDFYRWHDGQKVDENKRTGKSKMINDVFGVEGTFKKLELD